MMLRKWCLVLLTCLLFTSAARAQLVIEVTSGADKLLPIAIVPFGYNGTDPLPQDVAQIVQDDLVRSGLFKAIPRSSMLSQPSKLSDVYYRDWRLLKADYVLIGSIKNISGDRYRVGFQLLNVLTQKPADDYTTIDVTKNHLRDAAHYISDAVFKKLTGIRGDFSTRILYVTEQNAESKHPLYKLQVADADGYRPQVIVESDEPILSPAWSRNGRDIAYVMFKNMRPRIFIQELATGKRKQIMSFKGLNGSPAFSPDGKKLALVLSKDGNAEIYTLDLATQKLERMTHNYAIDTEPAWGPKGNSIYFTSDRGGNPQIYRLDIKTKKVERITFEGDSNYRARLTPDGRFLVCIEKVGGDFHIAVQDLKTGRVKILTHTDLDESPTISPNGTMVMYATTENGKEILAVVSVDGLVKYKLPSTDGEVREPAWSPYFN
ncbi:Tol-Pal system beta propeller repeat protein TolB [Marinomonas spartinae]|uniref:Tol-Pal system beta propeller repeat protein TolB n=1 Tax=Marinomonas spartinae TaxID=1792290 RepID=UPI0018F1643A|nr:Tol-Pal system beta propeller repeat protein TolB [Marinomonas spartinae]MBJ7554056.1 Tol-Pal system protein TolB [Marinomonas spartinae]